MSNAARKARKRFRVATFEAAYDVSDVPATRRDWVQTEAPAFQHPRKTGTPVSDRSENQMRPSPQGLRLTSKARRRLAEYVDRNNAAKTGANWPDHRRVARAA